jgi:hypothetical protein
MFPNRHVKENSSFLNRSFIFVWFIVAVCCQIQVSGRDKTYVVEPTFTDAILLDFCAITNYDMHRGGQN